MRLFSFETRWMLAIFDGVVPSATHAQFPRGAAAFPMQRYSGELMKVAPFEPALGIRLAVWVVTFSPFFILGKATTFAGLSSAEREDVLERLSQHRIYALRELPNLLKMVATLGWCGIPEVQRQVGIGAHDGETPEWLGAGSRP